MLCSTKGHSKERAEYFAAYNNIHFPVCEKCLYQLASMGVPLQAINYQKLCKSKKT